MGRRDGGTEGGPSTCDLLTRILVRLLNPSRAEWTRLEDEGSVMIGMFCDASITFRYGDPGRTEI